MERALQTTDKSVLSHYKLLQEKGFFNRLIAANTSQMVHVNSIRCNFKRYPYEATTYARQRIMRKNTITERSLVTTYRQVNVFRSDNNPIAAAESPAAQPASTSETAQPDEGRVLLREVGRERPATVKRVLSDIYRRNRADVKGIHTRKYGMEVEVRGIYVHNDVIYLHVHAALSLRTARRPNARLNSSASSNRCGSATTLRSYAGTSASASSSHFRN